MNVPNDNPYSPPSAAADSPESAPPEQIKLGRRILRTALYLTLGIFFLFYRAPLASNIGYSMPLYDAYTLASWTISGTLLIWTAYNYWFGHYRRALLTSNVAFALSFVWMLIR